MYFVVSDIKIWFFMFQHGWMKAMKEDAAVQASFLKPEIYAKFYNSRKTGKADYDLFLR
jgi:hypothetical protein